jgi:hypothetical protein
MLQDKRMIPVSREQLILSNGKKETNEEVNLKKIYHIVDPIYHMVIFSARTRSIRSYTYKIGYISDTDLEIILLRLRNLFPGCIVRSNTSPDYECGGSSPNLSTSVTVYWC